MIEVPVGGDIASSTSYLALCDVYLNKIDHIIKLALYSEDEKLKLLEVGVVGASMNLVNELNP